MPSAPSCALGTIIRDRNECLDAKFTPRHYYSPRHYYYGGRGICLSCCLSYDIGAKAFNIRYFES